MTWTAQLTYTAGGLTSDDIDALTDALGDGGIVYGSDTGRLQITLEVEAPTLQDAADTVLRMTAAATGLLKLTRLQALTTAEFVAGRRGVASHRRSHPTAFTTCGFLTSLTAAGD